MNLPKLGSWKPEPVDSNDDMFSDNLGKMLLTETPVNGIIDLRKVCSPIENQRDLSSCVGNGVVGALEMLNISKGRPHVDLSRLFVYYNARLAAGDADRDEGSYIRLAMGTLSSQGTCTEAAWSYDTSKVFFRPTWKAYREAFTHKITSYYRIAGSGQERIDAIKRALEAGHPVVFGMIVDKAFQQLGSHGIVDMPASTRVNPGGHCMVIVGYRDNGATLIVRNSWGTVWGDKGYCYLPAAYLDASDANDFWVPYLT